MLHGFIGDAANDETRCDLRYQGQLYDAESGLYYNRHRYYDPETGQYISPDPIGLDGGFGAYAYVHNPLEWVDPFGLSIGRAGKQARLKELANDPKQPGHVRGWIKQEQNSIARGQRTNFRNPPGHQLAHWRGYEASKGYGYEYSDPQHTDLHRRQHKYDAHGKKNKPRVSKKAVCKGEVE